MYTLVDDIVTEIERRVQDMDRYLRSPAFKAVFGTDDTDPDADGIIGAADTVMEFYAAHLLLARQVGGVSAPNKFADVIENTAHLVDRSLDGVDRFITELVGTAAVMPSLALASGGDALFYEIPFKVHMDNARLARIIAPLHRLRGHCVSAVRWGAISRIASTRLGERLGSRLFD